MALTETGCGTHTDGWRRNGGAQAARLPRDGTRAVNVLLLADYIGN